MSSLSFLSHSARSSLKPEHLPLAVAKWLVSAVGRKPNECIYTLPEYDPEAKQAVLSWLNANNRPMPRLLFESREKAWNFLAALPSEERTFYIYIPKDAPVAFYLDIDKPNDERWKGPPQLQLGRDASSAPGVCVVYVSPSDRRQVGARLV